MGIMLTPHAAPVVVGQDDKNRRISTFDVCPRQPGFVQCLMHHFQQNALLRVHDFRFGF